MADREAPPAMLGPVYVQVEYDYAYQAKDKMVSIHQGESYLLVKKTNQDWWQVRTDGDAKAFYVPAQYVREVRRVPPHHPALKAKPTVLDLRRPSDENLNRTTPEMSSFGRPSPSPSSDRVAPPSLLQDANHNLSSPQRCKLVAELVLLHNNNNQRHRTGDESPPPAAGRDRSPDGEEASPQGEASPADNINKRRNDSESGDELSSSSTEHMQTASPTGGGRSDSPVYTNLQELKISGSSLPPVPSGSPLHLLGDWETHRDPSGRHFYYNRATGERTWKPPRSRDTAGSTGGGRVDGQATPDSEPPSLEENCPSTHSSQSDSRCGSPPRGWSEELDEHGHTLYVSEHTQEKWIKHVDEQGRPYYYSADGSRSEWELPKYNSSPPPSDIPKSRSLERKQPDAIVLTKWRHSTYVLDLNDKPSEKCGVLNVTRITENGKRVRKNWTSSWTVLQGSSLLFAKGQGGGATWSFYHSGSFPEFCLTLLSSWNRSVKLRPAVSFVQTAKFGSQSKPEFSVDLRGGSVDWASRDKSSKKHVMELKTRQGTELLIQSDIDSVVNDWFRALTEAVNTHREECDQALDEDSPESPGAEKENRDKKSRATKTSVGLDSSDQKKTRMKLKKFLVRRPTYQAVRDKGYIKDQVFGCSLLGLCQRENTSVPNFVKMCIEHVENTGLGVDGLYRVSGNLAVIQKLRFAVNHDEPVDLRDGKWEDIHVTTGALKMFFRELSEPLFTFGSFEDFVNAIKNSDYQQRVNSIRDLVKKLPKPNHDTMQLLFQHLRRVIDHGESNRMTTQSVSIVFGPTLLRPETESGSLAVHMVYQNQIVELVLLEYDAVFSR